MDILSSLNSVILPGHRVLRIAGWDALKKFPMARDTEAIFLDEDDNKNILYMKKCDANGVETCGRYRYEDYPVEEFEPEKYVTIKDFNEFREEISDGNGSQAAAVAAG